MYEQNKTGKCTEESKDCREKLERIMKGEEEEKIISTAEMESSGRNESILLAINPKSENPNQLNQINGGNGSSAKNTNSNPAKAKSCKGCLYYSSVFKDQSRNPLCLGLTRSLPNVPRYIVGKSEAEASTEGRSLTDFRYGCVGYALYVDRKEQGSNGQETQTELPVCVGLEVLVDRRGNNADSASAPMTRTHNREDSNRLPQRRSPKPTNSTGEEFLSRFTRNANLVANGVAKNVRRLGNQIKQGLDDILFRRPK